MLTFSSKTKPLRFDRALSFYSILSTIYFILPNDDIYLQNIAPVQCQGSIFILSTIYFILSTIYYLLSTIYYIFYTSKCRHLPPKQSPGAMPGLYLYTLYYLLSTTYYLLSTIYFILPNAHIFLQNKAPAKCRGSMF